MNVQPNRELSTEEKRLIRDLAEVGAVTPIQFEIKTHQIGTDARKKLTQLVNLGYVERTAYKGGTENEVFALSPKGYKFIRTETLKSSRKVGSN